VCARRTTRTSQLSFFASPPKRLSLAAQPKPAITEATKDRSSSFLLQRASPGYGGELCRCGPGRWRGRSRGNRLFDPQNRPLGTAEIGTCWRWGGGRSAAAVLVPRTTSEASLVYCPRAFDWQRSCRSIFWYPESYSRARVARVPNFGPGPTPVPASR
jgi:hypothetical protein